MLSELLAKNSDMPVVEAKNVTTVQPNHVYVIRRTSTWHPRTRLQLSRRPHGWTVAHTY